MVSCRKEDFLVAGETFERGDEAAVGVRAGAFEKKDLIDFCFELEEEGGGLAALAGVRAVAAFSPAMMSMNND